MHKPLLPLSPFAEPPIHRDPRIPMGTPVPASAPQFSQLQVRVDSQSCPARGGLEVVQGQLVPSESPGEGGPFISTHGETEAGNGTESSLGSGFSSFPRIFPPNLSLSVEPGPPGFATISPLLCDLPSPILTFKFLK